MGIRAHFCAPSRIIIIIDVNTQRTRRTRRQKVWKRTRDGNNNNPRLRTDAKWALEHGSRHSAFPSFSPRLYRPPPLSPIMRFFIGQLGPRVNVRTNNPSVFFLSFSKFSRERSLNLFSFSLALCN